MSLGFSPAFGNPFTHVWANDFDKDCVDTYACNISPHVAAGDILELLKREDPPEADIVIGGPPCQGFSLLNKNRRGDERKSLWVPFLNVVEASGASVFVIENVPHILGTPEHAEIMERAREMGFSLAYGVLNAADYGVPQRRRRAFIVGCKTRSPLDVFPPRRTHGQAELDDVARPPWRTVRDAIGDLPEPVGTEVRTDVPPPLDLHFGRTPTPTSMARYRAIPREGMNRFDLQRRAPELTPGCWIRKKSGGTDLFGRLWWDRPAFTIRTEFFKPEKGRYLHPKQHRPITHREAARLQGFPDDFVFCGSKISIARQIGNAVPPPLAASVARCALELLQGVRKSDRRILAAQAL